MSDKDAKSAASLSDAESHGDIENFGDIDNFGDVDNYGDFENYSDFENYGDLENSGDFENYDDLGNHGDVENYADVENYGDLGNYGDDAGNLCDENAHESQCSTSESGMSNTFLDEVFMGQYDGWNDTHNHWLGRWVSHDQMKTFLYSMQSFQFLNMQEFMVQPKFEPESFAKGTKVVDKFLEDTECDIVLSNKRFPDGAFHFVDEVKWTEAINGIYTALNYIQGTEVDLTHFYDLWVDALRAAFSNLREKITREEFEHIESLVWKEPSFDPNTSWSAEG